MLKLETDQWAELQIRDARQFVAAVSEQFIAGRPELQARSGREATHRRMQAAYDYSVRTQFSSTPHIVRLLYLAADAPEIYEDPFFDRYLRKPGASPEQRFDDLNAVLDKKLEKVN